MNRKLTKSALAALAACVMVLNACKKDEKSVDFLNDGKVRFTSSINSEVATRATENAWDANDNIGVFMTSSVGNTALSGNKKYTTTGNGNFSAQGEDIISYPADGGDVNFVAYYPFQENLTGNIVKVDISSQANPAAIDLMYSNNAKNFNKNSAADPALEFNHQLAKVVLNIKAGTGLSSIDGVTASFEGMNTKADFDLNTGMLSAPSEPANIAARVSASGTDQMASVILLPVDDATGKTVTFSVPSGETYTWSLPTGTKFEKGKKYIYNIVLQNSAPPKVLVVGNASITNWVEVPSSGDINLTKNEGDTSTEPTNPQPAEQQIFMETFGGTPVVGTSTFVGNFTGFDSQAPVTFQDIPANSAGIRVGGGATGDFVSTWNGQNLLFLFPNKAITVVISGINTTGVSNLKLSMDIARESKGSYSDITVKYNGTVYPIDPSLPAATDRNPKNFTFDLSNAAAAATGSIEISVDASNTMLARIDNISLKGLKN